LIRSSSSPYDAGRLIGMTPPARPAGQDRGDLEPGPDAEADAEINRLVWAAAVLQWENLGDEDAAADARVLLSHTRTVWQNCGRPTKQLEGGLHPVQRLAMERLGIVAERSADGLPLTTELDEDPGHLLPRVEAAFSLTDVIRGLFVAPPGWSRRHRLWSRSRRSGSRRRGSHALSGGLPPGPRPRRTPIRPAAAELDRCARMAARLTGRRARRDGIALVLE